MASEVAMATVPKKIALPDTLKGLAVNPHTGLTRAEVDIRRKAHGYNEVAEKKDHPALRFLSKFWGLSAWMLELIMVLSAVLHKLSDLAVVSALLIVNAVLSFAQERRAAGVVETLRKREFLQCCRLGASVLRRPPGWKIDKRAPTEPPKITVMKSPNADCA
jgi:magnesium-transporting ATPase (P-type)